MINDPNLDSFFFFLFNPIMLWHFLSDEPFLILSIVYLLTEQSAREPSVGSHLWLLRPADAWAVMRDYFLFTKPGISKA